MTYLEERILQQVKTDHDYVVGLRRYFHKNPELPKEEFLTQQRIEEELDKLGIAHRRVAGTGVYAELEGTLDSPKPKRTIVLRADIDALPVQEETGAEYASSCPGKMHACGHDAHGSSLLGAARIISANRELFAGKVIFTWQPGEEIGYGARIIVDEGDIDEADRSFGVHLASNVPVGSVVLMPGANNASVDWFRINVHGLGAHVSTPELGVDAAYIASQIVVAAQSLVTRQTSPMDNVLIGIGKIEAGTAYNVIAQEASLEGTIRVFSPELRKLTKERLEKLSKVTAELYGGSADVEWNDNTSPLINDEQATKEAQKTAISLFGADKVITQRQPALGGDDFAEYILRVPGAYAYIGSGNDSKPNTVVAHHNSHFDIDEDCLTTAVALYSAYAIEYLNGEV
jgi:amidohydrolase